MSKTKCPKCGRKFTSGRGLPAHVEACDGIKDLRPIRKSRKPRSKAPTRAPRRTAKPKVTASHVADVYSIVEKLLGAQVDLELKAAALGRMIEELGKI